MAEITIEDLVQNKVLSVATRNVCHRGGIMSVDELLKYYTSQQDFKLLVRCGHKTAAELEDFCKDYLTKCNISDKYMDVNLPLVCPHGEDELLFRSYLASCSKEYSSIVRGVIDDIVRNNTKIEDLIQSLQNLFQNSRNIHEMGAVRKTELLQFIKKMFVFCSALQRNKPEGYFMHFVEINKFRFDIYKHLLEEFEKPFLKGEFMLFRWANLALQKGGILTKREYKVLISQKKHYSIAKQKTFELIGDEIGVTNERVRQITVKLPGVINEWLAIITKEFPYLLKCTSYSFHHENETIIINRDFAEEVNKNEGVGFSINFFYNAIAALKYGADVLLFQNIKKVNNYLVISSVASNFDFDGFYLDMLTRTDGKIKETYTLDFQQYLSKFISANNKEYIERVKPICKMILYHEFRIDLHEDSIEFKRNTKKLVNEYVREILEEKGKPMYIDDIYNKLPERSPPITKNKHSLRGSIQAMTDTICFGRSSTYGLKKWEKSDSSIKGGTIRDIVQEYLEMHNEPKHLYEITRYVNQFRNTQLDFIRINLRLEAKKRYILYPHKFIGLVSKVAGYKKFEVNEIPQDIIFRINKHIKKSGDQTLTAIIGEFSSKMNILPIQVEYILMSAVDKNILQLDENGMVSNRKTLRRRKLSRK